MSDARAGGPTGELDRHRVLQLFDLLDARLRRRGVGGSIYVVGGVAIALTVADTRRTADLDALVSETAVLEEAQALAAEEGLPPSWLNENARPYIPPRPEEALVPRRPPGLDVHIAPLTHLLAMKLVALRQRDLADINALVEALKMRGAPADTFTTLVLDVYADQDILAMAIGVSEAKVVEELNSISNWLVTELATVR